MEKIRFCRIRLLTLLLTYLAWGSINLLFAFWFCDIFKEPLTRMPYFWGVLHIAHFWSLKLALCEGDMSDLIFVVPGILAGLSVVAGLLINRWWAILLIVIGMSIWFLSAFCILAMGA